jgi:hypothetical protein
MASQAQLEADIALATAQVASLELQLDAASGSPQPDPAVIANLERQLNAVRISLSQLQSELNNLLVASDPNTNVGAEAQVPEQQQTINPNSDPNTNIGAEGQDVTGFEPLTEPPITNDGDEFSGIDEQIQRQKDLEDGSLEFAGIDDQIAANETTLQEPPQLSEEEINQQIQQAGQGSDTEESVFDPTGNGGAPQGLTGPKTNTQSQATQQDTDNFYQTGDWRVRLSLAPSADYLYKAKGNEGILLPLAATNGIIFPYTPNISVNYAAQYDPSDITHSNYKTFQYKSSSVDSFSMSCDFTAQDTFEANYLLAVIHFLRSVTKMFYGQDENPKNGTPPPLCYLTGLGAFQFDKHPLAITSFTYSLPTEVDYIRATNTTTTGGVNKSAGNTPINTTDVSSQRLGGLPPGGGSGAVNWQNTNSGSREPTYVPTKMQIQISAVPIVTRNDISRNFSLKDYATGNLLRGSKRKQGGGGIW